MFLQRVEAASGPVYYVSPLLREAGVPHAFSTRLGGVSSAPFDALNLGNPGGGLKDDRANILQNYARLFDAAKLNGREHCWLHQIHGAVVARVIEGTTHDNNDKGDALATRDANRVLSVRVADCCPILLASDDGACVAAVHSGWRGTVAQVVLAALEVVLKLKGDSPTGAKGAKGAKNILAAIGPCIGMECFETGPEVLAEFDNVFGAEIRSLKSAGGKGRANIREAVRVSLLRAGVPERNIDTTELCTHRDSGEFFSHRREHGVTGRMAALIAVKHY